MAIRNNGDHWPHDLETEILLKLPIKSIIRFKCVSKTWYHLFKNPTFVSKHINLNKRNTRLLVHYADSSHDSKISLRLFDEKTLHPYRGLRLPHHIPRDNYAFDIVVDNGLVCLCDVINYKITLWNPATSEWRILPECNVSQRVAKTNYSHIGFGFDQVSNDYKVIKIQEGLMPKTGCAVYKMSTNSWRVMSMVDVMIFEDIYVCPTSNKACVDGVYYWKVLNTITPVPSSMLLAFHLGNEAFQLIQLPPQIYGELLLPYRDHICLASEISRTNTSRNYEVWVLNGVENDWIKLLRIEHVSGFDRIFSVWSISEVLVGSIDGKLLLCDVETKECRDFGNQSRGRWYDLQVYAYEESLVAISRD